MKRSGWFLILSLCLAPLPLAAAESADPACYNCHRELKARFAKGTIHSPVADGDCTACHQEHGDQNKLLLTQEVPALCYDCHDELTEAHKHEPVADGSCLDCHSVHNSDSASLLNKAVPDLCNDCHDPIGGKNSVHEPAAGGDCLDCHNAHQSQETALLSKAESALCSDCHEEMDKSNGKFPHEPVSGGECSECHQAHQSDYKNLLTAAYDQERYAFYSAEEYTLCFNCHEQKVFEDPSAAEDTAFRNGQTNLHYLHVQGRDEPNKYGIKKKKEGMTCMGCHLVHGTDQAKLIRINIECGPTYCYTMNYRKFEGGGSCVVGCHKPKVYKQNPLLQENTAAQGQSPLPVAQQNQPSGGAAQ